MPLHCSCIDMPKFVILTAYIRFISVHLLFFQTRYFPNSFIVMFSPSVFFSLFVVSF